MVDTENCVGCYACEIACKEAHGLSAEKDGWIKVVRADAKRAETEEMGHYLPVICVHCTSPPCVEACPEGAISQREDGIVLLDSSNCTGCKSCLETCPFEAIFFDEGEDVAFKCDLCVDRPEGPVCV